MPFRSIDRHGRCEHCGRPTSNACVRCAAFICERCEQTHDDRVSHKF